MIEKYMQRVEMEQLSYSQFVKRYTRANSVPKQYTENKAHFLKEIDHALTQDDIDNEDYLFNGHTPIVGEVKLKLPKYIPVVGSMVDRPPVPWKEVL